MLYQLLFRFAFNHKRYLVWQGPRGCAWHAWAFCVKEEQREEKQAVKSP